MKLALLFVATFCFHSFESGKDAFNYSSFSVQDSYAQLKESTGDNFIDHFSHFESSLWAKDDDHLVCPYEEEESCVYATQLNNRFIFLKADATDPSRTELQLVMQNGCSRFGLSDEECCENEKCAFYTAGQLTSKNSYSYGSFYFVIEPAETKLNSEALLHNAWSCLSLIRNPYQYHVNTQMEIAMCIPSQFTPHISIVWRYGKIVHHRVIRVGFDPTKQPVRYRIDWNPRQIAWFADGKILATIHPSSEWKIPDAPLYIKAHLLPQETDDTITEPELPADIEFRMYLSQIAYRKLLPPNVKDELFTIDANSRWKCFLTFIILLMFLVGCLYRRLHMTDTKIDDGYIILVDEGDNNGHAGHGGTHSPLD